MADKFPKARIFSKAGRRWPKTKIGHTTTTLTGVTKGKPELGLNTDVRPRKGASRTGYRGRSDM